MRQFLFVNLDDKSSFLLNSLNDSLRKVQVCLIVEENNVGLSKVELD